MVLPPAAPNQAHKSSDFSEMQRTANRQLRKMYTQWQNEVEQLKAQNNMVATSAIFNQASGNASLIGERNRAEEKQKELDALREENSKLKEFQARAQATLAETSADCDAKLKAQEADHKLQMQSQADGFKSQKLLLTMEYEATKLAAVQTQREELEMKHRREIKEVRRSNREKLKKFREEHFLYKTKCKHSFKKFRARADSAEEAGDAAVQRHP